MRPRIRARLLPTTCYLLPATCYPTTHAPATAACMLLLLPPRGTHASGDGLRGPVKNAMGPSLFYRNLTNSSDRLAQEDSRCSMCTPIVPRPCVPLSDHIYI
jgi:hypothetical protein